MITWLIVFYAIVALLWTFSRYQRAEDKAVWKKDFAMHIVESLGWIFILLRSDYGDSGKKTEDSDEEPPASTPFKYRGKSKK